MSCFRASRLCLTEYQYQKTQSAEGASSTVSKRLFSVQQTSTIRKIRHPLVMCTQHTYHTSLLLSGLCA